MINITLNFAVLFIFCIVGISLDDLKGRSQLSYFPNGNEGMNFFCNKTYSAFTINLTLAKFNG